MSKPDFCEYIKTLNLNIHLTFKFPAPKCTTGYVSNEKKPSAKFHFPVKNAELNKQWIYFVNKRDTTKHSMLCELYFEEKYLLAM